MSDQQTVPPQTEDRGEPDSPLELPHRDLKQGLRDALQQFKADKGTLLAAGMAFYWFLAVFPALLAAVGITGLVNASQQAVGNITKAINTALPGDASKVLTDALNNATQRRGGSSVAATIIGIALALWSASAGMVALQTGLDAVYKVPEERTYVKKRVRALLLIAVSVLLGGLATAAIVLGQPIGHGLRDHLPFGGAFILVWTVIRWAVGLIALVGLFAAFYYLGPNRETPRWTWLSPGGVVGTVIWLLASIGFSFYVSSLGSYGKTYGSLTGVVVLLLWLFLTAIAVVLGGEVNAGLERQGEEQRRGGRARRGSRPQAQAHVQVAPTATPATATAGAAPHAKADGPAPTSYEQQWMDTMRRLREQPDRR
jgi:membrane protein